MIQDIAPHRYDNTYHIQKPGAQDYVFCIQKSRILLRETVEEHVLTIPRREEIEAAVPELMDRAVYLFSVDEKPYFLVSVPEKEAEEILAKLTALSPAPQLHRRDRCKCLVHRLHRTDVG